MLIDAHQHFWRLADRAGHWPPPALAPIHRDFLPVDLAPLLAQTGVAGTVLVQSLPTMADTRQLLQLAAQHSVVKGVVGWVDLLAPDAPSQITELARHRQLKGLRPMLQDLPDTRWIAQAALAPAIHAMQAHGLVLDALVLPQHLGALLEFAQRFADLPIVIDHAAKPEIARGLLDPWRQDMAALAALPHVHCKLSGLLTEAGVHTHPPALKPYVDHLFATFGPERLIWGSDWPVLNLATQYPDWLAMAQTLCQAQPGMDETHMASIFGGNARRFYRLDDTPH
ncbi:amidohydrolase family protein [Rhodoferax saidenbachensis]|uniref:Amidohydrolase n=1 Tax=Rhodoferax saidenbachensis TaxID=1484693 RepID=A0A1P8KCX2_9BURK|nr:amidohydrolase family protein [Rhodoferax saidenbachensis]APW43778.1 amidohydrolase [Rhodoferax saidenbachensis]